ncbi:MAG: MFS transporter [Pirellulales bacterium]|nr:MFS transporter [Pirellulales bacterium]
MIRPASPEPPRLFRRNNARSDRQVIPLRQRDIPNPFGAPFWFTYVANLTLMTALSLLYRYADFVTFLGGSEFELGLITGLGMVGSLLMRFLQGFGIDRYGVRMVWLISLLVFVGSLIAHALPTTVHGPAVYFLQLIFRTAAAGAYGAAITFIALRANAARMAEAIGMLGTSGFIAMAIGPILGDLLLGNKPTDRGTINLMFFTAAGMGIISWASAILATRGQPPPPRRRQLPLWAVLRRYHPGLMLFMGILMGVGSGLPTIFVRAFTTRLEIESIAWYFTTYAMVAFFARILTRRICEIWGARPTIITGMLLLVVGTSAFDLVRTTWQLAIPGLFAGIAHALLFPAIVATGTSSFPERYRGLGTAAMLAMIDFGVLAGAPVAGGIVSLANALGLPGFSTMYLSIAAALLLGAGWYAIAGDKKPLMNRRQTLRRVAVDNAAN